MRKLLSFAVASLLLVTSVFGTNVKTYADDWDGPLTIVVTHSTNCGCGEEEEYVLHEGETHVFVAKITETETGKDVSDQYTVEWEPDFYHGDVAEACSISPSGNECSVACTGSTSGYNILLFARIMGDGDFLGIGYGEFKIDDASAHGVQAVDESTTEETTTEVTTTEETAVSAEETTVAAEQTENESVAETVSAEAETKDASEEDVKTRKSRSSTAGAAGAAAAIICCSAAAAKKKKNQENNKDEK